MPRAPDKRIEQAKELYLQGKKLIEIANQLNLPEGTVRRWKSTHKWDSERSDKNSERSEKKKVKKKKPVEREVNQVIENCQAQPSSPLQMTGSESPPGSLLFSLNR